jgi:hypothetical protein
VWLVVVGDFTVPEMRFIGASLFYCDFLILRQLPTPSSPSVTSVTSVTLDPLGGNVEG